MSVRSRDPWVQCTGTQQNMHSHIHKRSKNPRVQKWGKRCTTVPWSESRGFLLCGWRPHPPAGETRVRCLRRSGVHRRSFRVVTSVRLCPHSGVLLVTMTFPCSLLCCVLLSAVVVEAESEREEECMSGERRVEWCVSGNYGEVRVRRVKREKKRKECRSFLDPFCIRLSSFPHQLCDHFSRWSHFSPTWTNHLVLS